MIRDYQMVSPSLDGILSHDSIVYEGLRRPAELLRVLDGPARKGRGSEKGKDLEFDPRQEEHDCKVLREYFQDVYGMFMKKLSHFYVESEIKPDETLKLQAMLQEMIKVKRLLQR